MKLPASIVEFVTDDETNFSTALGRLLLPSFSSLDLTFGGVPFAFVYNSHPNLLRSTPEALFLFE